MKKVLIMMSTYNGEKYLKEQLDSLLKQKNVLINILIRDDGSTDSTLDILKEYRNDKISCLLEKNIGSTNSFFELIKNASLDYDYYAFCDQDDIWLEKKLEKGIYNLTKFSHDKPSLYYSSQILIDSNATILNEHILANNRSIKANFIFNQMAGCSAIFNKKLLEILKQYIPKNIKGHDVWCYKVCACFSSNIYVDKNSYILYRQHENNVVGIDNRIRGKFLRAKKYIFDYSISNYAKELLIGYAKELSEEWKVFLKTIIDSNKNFSSRISLLKDKQIKFNSLFLRIIFIIKVIIKKI